MVDVPGCSLPVCAASYACIGELVQDGRNGLLFSDAQQLAQHLLLFYTADTACCTQVVDMLGCGLPVCGTSCACIGELVQDGSSVLLFSDAQQLAQHLLLEGLDPRALRTTCHF